jgi:sortase A
VTGTTTADVREGPKMNKRLAAVAVGAAVLVAIGVALICYPKATDLKYEISQWSLEAEARTRDAETGAAEAEGRIRLPAGAVAKLEIPAIGVDAFVLEGTERETLDRAPGHYEETPLPGEEGNSAIAGHRTMHGRVFHDLDDLEPGDDIVTHTHAGRAVYRVVDVSVVAPTALEVVAPTDESRLTLTTCHPKGSARQRLVVAAVLAE